MTYLEPRLLRLESVLGAGFRLSHSVAAPVDLPRECVYGIRLRYRCVLTGYADTVGGNLDRQRSLSK